MGHCPLDRGSIRAFEAHMYTQAVINVLGDFVFLLLPIPAVIKSHFPLRVKISVIIIFSLGAMYTDPTRLLHTLLTDKLL